MTATLIPPLGKDQSAFRGEFLVLILFDLQMPQFSLGFNTVTMIVNWFDVMHASVSNGGFFCKFTFFLLLPSWTCTATGHYTGNAIADTFRICTSTPMILEVMGFLILIENIHFITNRRFPKKHSRPYLAEKIDRDAANRFIRKSVKSLKIG
jgi:hypothetical protein